MGSSDELVTGLHILGELTCPDSSHLIMMGDTHTQLQNLILKAGFNIVGEASHEFPGGGFTIIFALAESHVSIHTWPELKYVTLDAFVCNVTGDNSRAARDLFGAMVNLFSPTVTNVREVNR